METKAIIEGIIAGLMLISIFIGFTFKLGEMLSDKDDSELHD